MKPRRSWLFVPGADQAAHAAAANWGADVIVQELEDFTPPELRPTARELSPRLFDDGRHVEVPTYAAAKRLLESASKFNERASGARKPPPRRKTRG